jgi:shikimate dehydrogenase
MLYGLLGEKLGHSFSPKYFAEKFERESIQGSQYKAFELSEIGEFQALLAQQKELNGLNVTIPYKEKVIPYLHSLNDAAAQIGAVNTIIFSEQGLIGDNTDWVGFGMSLEKILDADLELSSLRALILGTGGSSKAVRYYLNLRGIAHASASTRAGRKLEGPICDQYPSSISYEDITAEKITEFDLIINCTPLGMQGKFEGQSPKIPFEGIGDKQYCYDLVYNPARTPFLEKAEQQGASIANGQDMLQIQAEASWKLWNDLSLQSRDLFS